MISDKRWLTSANGDSTVAGGQYCPAFAHVDTELGGKRKEQWHAFRQQKDDHRLQPEVSQLHSSTPTSPSRKPCVERQNSSSGLSPKKEHGQQQLKKLWKGDQFAGVNNKREAF